MRVDSPKLVGELISTQIDGSEPYNFRESGGEVTPAATNASLSSSPFIPGSSAQHVNSIATPFQGMLSNE